MLLALDLMSAAAASDVQGFYKKTIQELIYKWHNIDMKMLSPFLSSLKEGVSSRISARNKTPTQQAASFSKFWLLFASVPDRPSAHSNHLHLPSADAAGQQQSAYILAVQDS